jgi:hypothetical protein
MFQTMPPTITARRAPRTTEPIIKSSGSDLFMLANAKHEIKFHGTNTFGQLFVRTLPHNTEWRPTLRGTADRIREENCSVSPSWFGGIGFAVRP